MTLALTGVASPLFAQTAPPTLQTVSPTGAQRGTRARITLTGTNIAGATRLIFSEPGFTAAIGETREVPSEDALCREVAGRIADGEVLGWFQGRMELGPRALGNRSILCDPRRPDMRDVLNVKIKLREPFRPFAPSVLREAMGEWFEVDDDVPFMMKVYEIREEQRARIPAVTHVDGTGRPHTVTSRANPLYHRLIGAFAERMGEVTPLARRAEISYEKIAKGPIEATARLGVQAAEALATLDAEGKVEFPCEIELADASGTRVATATVGWHVRLNKPAAAEA